MAPPETAHQKDDISHLRAKIRHESPPNSRLQDILPVLADGAVVALPVARFTNKPEGAP